MSYTYLLEQGEESSAACFSDIPACVLSRLNLTAEKSCCNANETESCQSSPSGMTCELSMVNPGAEKSMSCAEDSPAKTLVMQASVQESPRHGAVFGKKCLEWFAKYDQTTCSWKIRQLYLFEDLEQSLVIWPKRGMMQIGVCFEPLMSELTTNEAEFGYWDLSGATALPTSVEIPRVKKSETGRIPTPTATDWKRSPMKMQYAQRPITEGCPDDLAKWAVRMSGLNHARLVPDLWEWAMGWPENWTALKPLATDKFQQWLDSHGIHSSPESQQPCPPP